MSKQKFRFRWVIVQEIIRRSRAGKFVGRVFEQHFHAALAGEEIDFFKRRKRGVDFALVELRVGDAQVLDQVAEGTVSAISMRALDFVHHPDALRFHRLGDSPPMSMDCGPVRPQTLSLYMRRVQRVKLQLRNRETSVPVRRSALCRDSPDVGGRRKSRPAECRRSRPGSATRSSGGDSRKGASKGRGAC